MHKNALFLFKNCKNRPALALQTSAKPPIKESWLRHCAVSIGRVDQGHPSLSR